MALHTGRRHKLHPAGLGFSAWLGQRLVACLYPEVVKEHMGAPLGWHWCSQKSLQQRKMFSLQIMPCLGRKS